MKKLPLPISLEWKAPAEAPQSSEKSWSLSQKLLPIKQVRRIEFRERRARHQHTHFIFTVLKFCYREQQLFLIVLGAHLIHTHCHSRLSVNKLARARQQPWNLPLRITPSRACKYSLFDELIYILDLITSQRINKLHANYVFTIMRKIQLLQTAVAIYCWQLILISKPLIKLEYQMYSNFREIVILPARQSPHREIRRFSNENHISQIKLQQHFPLKGFAQSTSLVSCAHMHRSPVCDLFHH